MAVTATLVEAAPNRLRYLLAASGGGLSLNITTTGAATPDLLTDSVQGPLKKLAKVITDGFAAFAAGAQTQAKARALWLSDRAGANPSPGDPAGVPSLVTTAICRITPRVAGATSDWTVDADVSGGNPVLTVSVVSSLASPFAYLDIFVPEAIG
jgi:hypothetical protein